MTSIMGRNDFFERVLHNHLPEDLFNKLWETRILIAGLGTGSNIAELAIRKGIGNIIITDPDVYEPHNIRQRGCLVSTLGSNKAEVMRQRLLDINPHIKIKILTEGI